MPEPFKNVFNPKLALAIASHFQHQWPEFNSLDFSSSASRNLEKLELKARSEQFTFAMADYLPDDFERAGDIILNSLSPALEGDIFAVTTDDQGIAGWAIMPITHYVALHGQQHFDLSMHILKECSKRFSSEFAIRFFLLQSPEKTLSTMKAWATDDNKHVRRLASEGARPRLPWAMQLPAFIRDPSPVIELLEMLKDDNETYVRRSVANNLNDIAKDHPELVSKLAGQWMIGAGKERKQLIRHACRTLLKQGNTQVLQLFGYQPPQLKNIGLILHRGDVIFGTGLEFSLSLSSNTNHSQALMIDYIIHHQKANGSTSQKVFKWRKITLAANQSLTFNKTHRMKAITTRVYYSGLHRVEIIINGISLEKAEFQLHITYHKANG